MSVASGGLTTRSPDVRRAWWALAVTPLALVVAMVAGDGFASALGFQEGTGELAPLPIMLVVGVPATLLLAAPAAIALVLARRAIRSGDVRGQAPAVVAGVLLLVIIGQSLLALTLGVLTAW